MSGSATASCSASEYGGEFGTARADRFRLDRPSRGVPATRMMDIAHDIKQRTGGKLHAVVATHRHKDHISGFETKKGGKGTGDVIRSLKPNLVVQPWTEDPELDPKATGPKAQRAVARKTQADGHCDAEAQSPRSPRCRASRERLRDARNLPLAVKGEVSFLGETNLANTSAVKNLMTMAKNSYVFCGSKIRAGEAAARGEGARARTADRRADRQDQKAAEQRPRSVLAVPGQRRRLRRGGRRGRAGPVPATRGEARLQVSHPRALAASITRA